MSLGDQARAMHADASGWDPRRTAFEMVRRTLVKTDDDRARVGLPRLIDADMTVAQRVNAIRFVLGGEDVSPETVAAAAAQCVALLMRMLKEQDASFSTGDEAA